MKVYEANEKYIIRGSHKTGYAVIEDADLRGLIFAQFKAVPSVIKFRGETFIVKRRQLGSLSPKLSWYIEPYNGRIPARWVLAWDNFKEKYLCK